MGELDFLEITDTTQRAILQGKQAAASKKPAAAKAEPKAAAKAVSAEETAVRGWLAEKGLEELTSAFVSKDYCDVALMREIGLDDDDLDWLEINDPQHRATLRSLAAAATTH